MVDPPFDLSTFDPSSLDLSHLHPAEQNRIRARGYDHRETLLLLQKQNPWTRSGKTEPLPPNSPKEIAPAPTETPKRKSGLEEFVKHYEARTDAEKEREQQEIDRLAKAIYYQNKAEDERIAKLAQEIMAEEKKAAAWRSMPPPPVERSPALPAERPREARTKVESIKLFFSHLHLALRVVAFGFALGELGFSWTMIDHGEFLAAYALLIAAVLFALIAIYGWEGIKQFPRATSAIKAIIFVAVLLVAIYFGLIFRKIQGDRPWTNLWLRTAASIPKTTISTASSEQQLSELRSELRNDSAKPLRDVGFRVKLNRAYSIQELGHFRIIYEVFDNQNHLDLFLACQSAYQVNSYFEPKIERFGHRCTVQYRTSEKGDSFVPIPLMGTQKYSGLLSSEREVDTLEWRLDLYDQVPYYKTLEDINRKNLYIFVTAPLADKISEIAFSVNNWELISAKADVLTVIEDRPIAPWIMPLTKDEKAVAWRGVYLKDLGGIAKSLPPDKRETVLVWSLDFALVHPKKLPEPEIKYDPLNPVKSN